MKKILFAVVLACFPWLVFAANLIAIGDSVTQSYRTGAWVTGQGWSALVAAHFGMTEINLGVSGATTAQMGAQWTAAMAYDPSSSTIIVTPGENDVGATAVSTFKSELDAQVGAAVVAGFPVIMQTFFIYQNSAYLAAAPAYLQAIRDIAAKYRLPLVDMFDAFSEISLTRSDYSMLINADGHPTVAGMVEIANLYQRAPYKNALMVVPPAVYAAAPPSGTNMIPTMTAATTGGVTVAGNDYAGVAWRVADGSSTDCVQWNQGGGGYASVAFPSAFAASSYSLQARVEASAQAYAPKSWTFEGSNDGGATWIVIDSRSNVAAWGMGETRNYTIASPVSYAAYRLNVSTSQGGTYLQYRNLQIFN